MAGMIGADLASLEGLKARIGVTGSEIEGRRLDADRIARDVVDAMNTAFDSAMTEIGSTMDTLVDNVSQMANETDQATWQGQNRENFVRAVGDFRSANEGIRTSSNEAYREFKIAADRVGDLVTDFEEELRSALNKAIDATDDMGIAVQSQRDAVDEAMNNSLSYSG